MGGTMTNSPSIQGATQAGLMKRRPPGLEVPSLAIHADDAIKDAKASLEVHAASLDVLQKATESISTKLFLTQRRGVAVAPKGAAPSQQPRGAAPVNEGAPWHKIQAP